MFVRFAGSCEFADVIKNFKRCFERISIMIGVFNSFCISRYLAELFHRLLFPISILVVMNSWFCATIFWHFLYLVQTLVDRWCKMYCTGKSKNLQPESSAVCRLLQYVALFGFHSYSMLLNDDSADQKEDILIIFVQLKCGKNR